MSALLGAKKCGERASGGSPKAWEDLMKSRVIISIVCAIAVLAAATGTASAGWQRGFSDVNTSANDEALCEEGITLSANISYQTSSFDFSYPDYDATVGNDYPLGTTNIDLYATATDATSFTNEIATVPVQTTMSVAGGTAASSYLFDGEATIPTPAGYSNGDTLYVWGYDGATLDLLAIPLTIGDEQYECDEAEPGELVALLWPGIKTFQYLPSVVAYFAPDIDHATVEVSANDSSAVGTVTNVAMFWGVVGVGIFYPQHAGVTCDTTSLDFTAMNLDGEPFAGSIPVTVSQRNCTGSAPAA